MGFIDFLISIYNLVTLKRDIRSMRDDPKPFFGWVFIMAVLAGFILIIYFAGLENA